MIGSNRLQKDSLDVRVSIIIPVLDEAKILPGLFDYLRDLAAEIIFVDGGSTDNTTTLVRAAGFHCSEAPPGRATQMNVGAAAASGDVLLFHHADTILPRGSLQSICRAVETGAIGGNFDIRLDTSRPLLRVIGIMITLRSRLAGVSTGDQAMFVTRSAFDKLGGFAEQPLFEDIDMSVRLRRLGKICQLNPPVLTSPRRWERQGAFRTVLRMWALRGLYYVGVSPERLARHYGATR
jgi:rSAM/selenodomain-associated transferase 2